MLQCVNIYCCTTESLTRHHLVPKPFRRGVRYGIVYLCRECHEKVHRMKTNTELAKNYNTKQSIIELLSSDINFRIERMMKAVNEQYEFQSMVA